MQQERQHTPHHTPAVSLAVVWPHAMHARDDIVALLSSGGTIAETITVEWSDDETPRNYSRFYRSRLNPPYRSFLEYQKGKGAFLTVVLADDNPRYEVRQTPSGSQPVDVRLDDAKAAIRSRLSDPFAFHTSDTPRKASRELMLLFGRTADSWSAGGSVLKAGDQHAWQADLIAADGWDSTQKLFWALGHTVRYVRIGSQPISLASEADPVRLLTDEPKELLSILGARPWSSYHPRAASMFAVAVSGRDVPFEVWTSAGSHADPHWCAAMLGSAVPDAEGVHVLPQGQAGEVERYVEVILNHQSHDVDVLAVQEAMAAHGYTIVRPSDRRVPFNYAARSAKWPRMRSSLDVVGWRAESLVGRLVVAPSRRAALTVREASLMRYPVARSADDAVRRALGRKTAPTMPPGNDPNA